MKAWKATLIGLLLSCLLSCAGSGTGTSSGAAVTVRITGASTPMNTGSSRPFLATVTGSSDAAVKVELGGGTITSAGVYTAPASPGTYTVKATAHANAGAFATAAVPVI